MKESEFILLLSKQCSGEITQEETTLLNEWLRQSPENEQFAKKMQRIWGASEGYTHSFSPDLNADFQKIKARIQPTAAPAFSVTWGQKLLRAAAVVAVLLTAVVAWQQFSAPSALEMVVLKETNPLQGAVLPDGSHVWLREGAELSYSKHWDGKERRVELKGEGYFEVSHDPQHPFKVMLENGGSVQVLGTQFGVCQVQGQTSVIVRSGKVRFSPTLTSEGPVLTAHQKAVYETATAEVRVSALNSLNELAWQAGGLEFVNTPLKQVVADLEKYYGVRIALRNPAVYDCPHSAPLTSQPIEKVLETLALTHQLNVKKTGERSFELSGGHCR